MACRDPIILIGTHRSGTTWLGDILSRSPDVAYAVEPRHIWSWGHWFRSDDRLTAQDATPRIRRHIREAFAEYVESQGKARLCEKTPNNSVRLPFVRAIYPEARILHILRDGRAVVSSTDQITQTGPGWERLWQRATQTRIRDWPAFLTRVPWLVDKALGRPVKNWGVRVPGLREWSEADPPRVVFARQWAATVRYAVDDGRAMDPSRYLEIHYEDVIRNPAEVMPKVADFLELTEPEAAIDAAIQSARPDRIDAWRERISAEELEALRPHLEPTLRYIGYTW